MRAHARGFTREELIVLVCIVVMLVAIVFAWRDSRIPRVCPDCSAVVARHTVKSGDHYEARYDPATETSAIVNVDEYRIVYWCSKCKREWPEYAVTKAVESSANE